MRADTLTLFGVFKKMLSEEDASLVVRYMEEASERKIIKTVENKIEHLATKEDRTKQIKWAFMFWIGQIGVILGMLYCFLGR